MIERHFRPMGNPASTSSFRCLSSILLVGVLPSSQIRLYRALWDSISLVTWFPVALEVLSNQALFQE
jgi:hypothetical protein